MANTAPLVLERAKVYHQIKSRLRGQLGKRWPVGGRLPPIKELARQLKTGQTNTHRAVKELVREGLLVSRSGHGTFVTDLPGARKTALEILDRFPNSASSNGSLEGMHVQILVAQREPDLFIRKAMDAFAAAMGAEGCRVDSAVYTQADQAPLAPYPKFDALMIINASFMQRLVCAPRQALAVINTAVESCVPMPSSYDVVSPDSEQGGFLAGKHLRDAGCRTACFLGCPWSDDATYDYTSSMRLAGFEQAWGEPLPAERRLVCRNYQTTYGARAVQDYLRLNPRPDAVFAASDELAMGFMHGALAHDLEAGRHYQIVGFDSQQRGRELPGGPLTSIEVPMAEMGELAARLLMARLSQPDRPPRRVFLGCSIFQGSTTHPAAKA